MRKFLLRSTAICAVGAAVLFGSAGARAGTFTVSATVIPANNQITGNWPSGSFSVSSFDVPGGNLQSVLVFESLTAKFSGSATFGSTAAYFSSPADAQTTVTVTSPTVMDGPGTLQVISSGYLVGGGSGSTTNVAYTSSSVTRSSNKAYSDVADWEASLVGPTVNISFDSASSPYNFPTLSDVSFNPIPTQTFTMTVAYQYTTGGSPTPAAPEPASALMLGAGLLALGAARRRWKRPEATDQGRLG